MAFDPSQGMGVGLVGIGDVSTVFKRKFRWTLELSAGGGTSCGTTNQNQVYFVKVAARPSVTFEETEVHFLNDKIYIPGKPTWEPLTVTFLDSNKFGSADLLAWLTAVYDFSKPSSRKMSSKRSGYCATVNLKMYDGCGTIMETWTLGDAWPQAMDFGDLDMSSSEIADVQVTLRYSMVTYEAGCGSTFSPCSCQGC
jgi:hypothetical protein